MSDEEDKNEEAEVEKPKGGGKKLIIGLLLGLLLGGGGAAGYFIMMPSDDGSVEKEEIVEDLPPEPELPDLQYAVIERLQLPNIYQGRTLNYIMMNISMEVIGEDDKALVEKKNLIIRDALIRHFSENSIGREDSPRIADFTALSEKVKEFANREVGKDAVKRVIITQSRSI